MSTLTDTHVIETLDRYNLLRLGEDPTPDRDLNDWDIYPYDIANGSISDNEMATISETRTYRPNWERIQQQITSRKREFLPPVDDVDALAWYLPIHFYGPEWGIYVREDAIEMLAGHIYDRLPAPTGSIRETEQLFQAAAWVLYLHEAFHHKTESFAIRLELARLSPVYIPYFENVYLATHGTDHQIEEIVATNEMYRRLQEPTYRKKLSPDVYDATRRFLTEWIPTLTPSYRLGLSFGAATRLNELCSQVSEGHRTPSQPADDWDIAPQMTRGLFSKDTVVYVFGPTKVTLPRETACHGFPSVPLLRSATDQRPSSGRLIGRWSPHRSGAGAGPAALHRISTAGDAPLQNGNSDPLFMTIDRPPRVDIWRTPHSPSRPDSRSSLIGLG